MLLANATGLTVITYATQQEQGIHFGLLSQGRQDW
jgi:hypothetical protein